MGALFRIQETPIDPAEAVAAVAGPDRGAIATFHGVARDHHEGRRVLWLEYHAYPAMAEDTLRQIGREVEDRFGTSHVAILHRVGRLRTGETSVVVAVAAAHRRQALEGCAYAIERLKAIVPIWKREGREGGVAWIEGPDACGAATPGAILPGD
jgi:molybdopterin synthase catalytic subunit